MMSHFPIVLEQNTIVFQNGKRKLPSPPGVRHCSTQDRIFHFLRHIPKPIKGELVWPLIQKMFLEGFLELGSFVSSISKLTRKGSVLQSFRKNLAWQRIINFFTFE